MTITKQVVKERRSGTQEMIAKLNAERTEVLVSFCKVAGLEPFVEEKPARLALQEFCQVLVDYLATAHFNIYERIANRTERRREAATLAEQIYPRILESTQIALDFNDKYDCADHCEHTDSLSKDLSTLGEELAQRIELEDQLIKALG